MLIEHGDGKKATWTSDSRGWQIYTSGREEYVPPMLIPNNLAVGTKSTASINVSGSMMSFTYSLLEHGPYACPAGSFQDTILLRLSWSDGLSQIIRLAKGVGIIYNDGDILVSYSLQ